MVAHSSLRHAAHAVLADCMRGRHSETEQSQEHRHCDVPFLDSWLACHSSPSTGPTTQLHHHQDNDVMKSGSSSTFIQIKMMRIGQVLSGLAGQEERKHKAGGSKQRPLPHWQKYLSVRPDTFATPTPKNYFPRIETLNLIFKLLTTWTPCIAQRNVYGTKVYFLLVIYKK